MRSRPVTRAGITAEAGRDRPARLTAADAPRTTLAGTLVPGIMAPAPRPSSQQVSQTLEHDAQVVSNTQLEQQLAGQPQQTKDEIIKINTQARHAALQVALLIPILAGLTGLGISFRMMRLPDPKQSGSGEQAVLG